MKTAESVKNMQAEARCALETLLARIPALEIHRVEPERPAANRRPDFLLRLRVSGLPYTLAVDTTRNGQPRIVRMAALQLRACLANLDVEAVPVLIAPYLSETARRICEAADVGFLDLVGNARLQFGNVYVDRTVAEKPGSERRFLQSTFSPKAARILRVMLREPQRQWRLAQLAQAARVSLGHSSNVRKALIEREWAAVLSDGIALTEPDALLDTWRENYRRPPGSQAAFYTHLHGDALEGALHDALAVGPHRGQAVLRSFSAAHWLAPYARTSTSHFYADEQGAERLREALRLSHAHKGQNVSIHVVADDDVFLDGIEPAPGIVCTGKVQTYLDLSVSGDRGREAAEHLRRELLQWTG